MRAGTGMDIVGRKNLRGEIPGCKGHGWNHVALSFRLFVSFPVPGRPWHGLLFLDIVTDFVNPAKDYRMIRETKGHPSPV
jgi:hypothetical protein